MKKKQKLLKPMSPHKARTNADICSLRRDNISGRKSWIMLADDRVVICEQASGEAPKGTVTLTRSDFAKLAAWYFKPQKRVVRS